MHIETNRKKKDKIQNTAIPELSNSPVSLLQFALSVHWHLTHLLPLSLQVLQLLLQHSSVFSRLLLHEGLGCLGDRVPARHPRSQLLLQSLRRGMSEIDEELNLCDFCSKWWSILKYLRELAINIYSANYLYYTQKTYIISGPFLMLPKY